MEIEPSFWIALVIGLVSAIPILKWPENEGFWAGVGLAANTIQSGTSHAGLTVTDKYRTTEQCKLEGPFGIPGSDGLVCRDVPVYAGEEVQFDFGQIIEGIVTDFAGAFTAAILVILIGLMFMDKKTREAKRRQIFHFLGRPEK